MYYPIIWSLLIPTFLGTPLRIVINFSNSHISSNPPPTHCYKVNGDVAGPTNNIWCIGVVIRDSDEYVVIQIFKIK